MYVNILSYIHTPSLCVHVPPFINVVQTNVESTACYL